MTERFNISDALLIRFYGFDRLHDIGAGGLTGHENEVRAADGEDGRLRGRAGRVDHDDIMCFVERLDDRNDARFVEFMFDGDRMLGSGAHPIRERVVEIGVDRGDGQAVKREAAEDQPGDCRLPRPALRRGYGDDAHPYEPRFMCS